MKPYYKYAQDVISGTVVACEWIKLACERFFSLMDDNRYYFSEERVDDVIDFISILKHYVGRHAGSSFVLSPWQQFCVANIYGFFSKYDGGRLVKQVYVEMARKNGKSALAAALCLYHLIADNEASAEVYLAANSKDQAKISFEMCSIFTRGIDPKQKYLIPFRDRVKYDRTLSLLRVLAADDSKLDGFNASMFLLDEYHAAKNSSIKDVLQSSQGMRENPMSIIITTAGFDTLGPCYQFRTMCTEVLKGVKEDDTLFAAIYSLDEGDDWKDASTWIKSNPNIGITVKPKYIKEQIQKAINSPSEEVPVKTKTVNLWCESSDVWIPDHYMLDVTKDIDESTFEGCECYVGIDLSSTSDMSAVAALWPNEKDGKIYFKVWYYLPEAALKEKRFKNLYGEWRRAGKLTVTPGNVIDYDYILNDLMKLDKKSYISKVCYDQWNATQFVTNATDQGMNMEPYSQTIGNFNRPTKELERLILSNQAVIDNNVINRHCFKNVVLKYDYMGNCKPTKQYEEKKIDGVIAMLMALGAYISSPHYSPAL